MDLELRFQSLQSKVLDLLHLGHFGMERMKQLARTAVYWPGIDAAIEMSSRRCDSCGEHQNMPSKPPVHPWMLPEKLWSRLHLDHAINFMGKDWLVITDAYSKYLCIHRTSSTSTRATLDLLEEDFAYFGFHHTLFTDNAPTFTSEEFQHWYKERGITHLTGAPYHSVTNGAATLGTEWSSRTLGTSRSFLMAQFGDNTGSSFSHADDNEPGDVVDNVSELSTDHPMEIPGTVPQTQRHSRLKTASPDPEYGPDSPRRSEKTPKPNQRYCC